MDIYMRIKDVRTDSNLSKSEFAGKIGVDNSQYGKIEAGKLAPTIYQLMEISSNFNISLNWLMLGKGDQYNTRDLNPIAIKSSNNLTGIPLIPSSAMAGLFNGEFNVLEYECERFVVPTFKGAEFLISVRGSSMYPKYNSGDIVACKKLSLDTFFQWNKVYVLDTDQGALIKRVKMGIDNDSILIVSDNPKYEPFELHRKHLYGIAIVIGVIRLE